MILRLKKLALRLPALFVGAGALLAGALLVSGCGGEPLENRSGLLSIGTGSSGFLADLDGPEVTMREKGGNIELILQPVPVWEDIKAQTVEVPVSGKGVYVRPRDGSTWEKPYARVGLFWNSQDGKVIMPVVIEQKRAIRIRSAELYAGNHSATLRIAPNFKFKPGGNLNLVASHESFHLPFDMLKAVSESRTAQLVLKTHRGDLPLGLDVVNNADPKDAYGTARYQFYLFTREVVAVRAQ